MTTLAERTNEATKANAGRLTLTDELHHDGITVTITTVRNVLSDERDRARAHARHQKAIQRVQDALDGLDGA